MWGNENPHLLLMVLQTDASTMKISVENTQKVKCCLQYDPAVSVFDIYPSDLAS